MIRSIFCPLSFNRRLFCLWRKLWKTNKSIHFIHLEEVLQKGHCHLALPFSIGISCCFETNWSFMLDRLRYCPNSKTFDLLIRIILQRRVQCIIHKRDLINFTAWLGISLQKTKYQPIAIYWEYTDYRLTCGYHFFLTISQQFLGLKNLSFVGDGQAPRATPCGLARLPNIYL